MARNSNFEQDLARTQFHAKFPTHALSKEAYISAPYFYAHNLIVFACLPHMFTLMLTP